MVIGCLLWCKDTNFNAIHNFYAVVFFRNSAVYYGAKILILMQFTTLSEQFRKLSQLFIMVQRY